MGDLVSIITPCYNSELYIAETISCVLAQTYTNWEWVIVNDCSTDKSLEVINSFKDSRIKIIDLENNSGAAVARNEGIKLAKGELIAFLDSDDIWLPEYLSNSISFMQNNGHDFIYSSYERRDENMTPLLKPFIVPEKIDYQTLLYNCPIFTSTVIYNTKKIGKIYFPLVDKREDHAFYLELLKKIPFAYGAKESKYVWYRIRKNSYSRNKLEVLIKQFNLYYRYLQLSLPKSVFFTVNWAINGMKKYEKFKFRLNR